MRCLVLPVLGQLLGPTCSRPFLEHQLMPGSSALSTARTLALIGLAHMYSFCLSPCFGLSSYASSMC